VPELQGKVAWVTGAGSGIGEAAALMLAEEGAAIVLTGRRREPLDQVAARIFRQGGTAHVQPGDLTEPEAVRRIGDYIALLPARLVMNEVMLSPTANRRYIAEIEKLSSL